MNAKTRYTIFALCAIVAISIFFAVSGCVSPGGGAGGGKEVVVYQENFENYAGGWMPRGGGNVSIVSGKAHTGDKSLYYSNRTRTHHGPMYRFVTLKPGQTYRISVWVMFDDDTAPTQQINISIQQVLEGMGESYINLAGDRLPKGEWVNIQGVYEVPRSRFETEVGVYFESPYKTDNVTPADLFSFYVDDIVITRLPPSPPPEIENDIPALYEVFSKDFPLGAAIEDPRVFNPSNQFHGLLRHFNVLVLGNGMKQDTIQPSEGRFNFAQGDALIDFAAKNNKQVRGHTLVWHQQVPAWLFAGSGPNGLATKQQLYARMERHIKETVGHFKGKVYTWDVVNEALEDNGELRDSKYYQIVGSHEFISNAFRWAHEADPNALLCLNDFSIEAANAKQDGFVKLIETLLDEGVPIHVAGIQAHINTSWPTVADMRNTIRRLAALGVKVQVTELDMSIYASGADSRRMIDRETLLEQASKYRALFEMFREEAKAGNLDMVVVWGLSDIETWLNNYPVRGRTDYPLFFGKDLKAKPAYWAIVDPSRLPIQLKKIDATRADRRITNINDPAWKLVSPRDISDKQGKKYGWFQIMWDTSNLYVKVHADNMASSAKLRFFIEPKNQKLEEKSGDAFIREFTMENAAQEGAGRTLLVSIPLEGKLESKVGFDLRLESGNSIYSWNDYDNTQDTSSLNYGTINLRNLPPVTYAKRGTIDMSGRATRDLDPAWEAATPVPMNVKTLGHTEEGSKFRVLWDDSYIYVLMEVVDPMLDDKSTIVHEQDTVEVFLDQNNGKTAIYEQDDGQYRVSFRNFVSFNGGDSSRFKSRTMVIAGGYRVEMAVPLYSIKPAPGTIVGFDVQVNDATNGARTGIRNWVNSTNMGYQSTADYGLLVLE
jgi:endo-1,4-beta-xylanase